MKVEVELQTGTTVYGLAFETTGDREKDSAMASALLAAVKGTLVEKGLLPPRRQACS